MATGAGGTAANVAGGEITGVAEVRVYGGPWQQEEKLRHYAGFLMHGKRASGFATSGPIR
jgi:hypothetical protein